MYVVYGVALMGPSDRTKVDPSIGSDFLAVNNLRLFRYFNNFVMQARSYNERTLRRNTWAQQFL